MILSMRKNNPLCRKFLNHSCTHLQYLLQWQSMLERRAIAQAAWMEQLVPVAKVALVQAMVPQVRVLGPFQ